MPDLSGAAKVCGTCRHFEPEGERLGSCGRWLRGYDRNIDRIPNDGVIVENDEGWGMLMGRSFGCVLWELNDPG